MQFIEHQKREPAAIVHYLAVNLLIAGEDELEHHVVGQQNIRRVIRDALARGCVLLSGVAFDGDRLSRVCQIPQELVDFFMLAVRQSVHRVNDDGAGPGFRIGFFGSEDVINNGNEKGK
ncbi:MAG: hypothetical protein BWY82_00377 [Verrucomicrobia bacterium ADurb.Bin474]|nr:MAG: hypothetical protein BWY82_00377 [Verrucomicrobia bacterium ADurb.Bin474]